MSESDWIALFLTLKLSLVTAVALIILALPLAWHLAHSKSKSTAILESVITLPLVLPPTVIGFYLLLALGERGWLGKIWADLGGNPLPFTFSGLIFASIIYSFPFAVQPLALGFSRPAFRRYLQNTSLHRVPRVAVFFKVILPLNWDAIAQAFVMTFAHTIGEFGVALMIGGNIPGETKVVSISIFDAVELANYQSAHRLSLVLIGIAGVALTMIYGLKRFGTRYYGTE